MDRQIATAQAWCDRHGVTLSPKSFADLGVSAFKERTKPALEDFIQAVEHGFVERGSFLLIEDDDRLSRRGWRHTQDLMHKLVNLGIDVVITKTGVIYNQSNINDLSQNIVLMVNADRSFKESERKSILIRSQRTRARLNREVTGKLPMWIKRAENGAQFEFNSSIDCIKRLVDLRLSGKSMQAVAKVLNTEGHVTGTGAPWSKIGVEAIVKNRALYGCKEYFDSDPATGRMNEKPIDQALGVFPAVIDFETWQSLQFHGKGAGRISKLRAYSTILKCGSCGGCMTLRQSKYKNEPREYRTCAKAQQGGCDQTGQVREPDRYLDHVLRGMTYQARREGRVSRAPELREQIRTLTETADILIQSGQSQRLAALYVRLGELEDALQAEQEQDAKNDAPITTTYAKILDIEDIQKRNLELRKLLKTISFKMIWKHKTQSKWVVKIEQSNGLKQSFILDQKHGFGNTEIIMNPINYGFELGIKDLQPWEE